jgi:hypothetical protein
MGRYPLRTEREHDLVSIVIATSADARSELLRARASLPIVCA